MLRVRVLSFVVVAGAVLAAAAVGASSVPEAEAAEALVLRARDRVPDARGELQVRERTLRWAPEQTAVVICDMWDRHWCRGATERVAEMAPRMDRVVSAARRRRVLIIHAPSSCMQAYKDTPQRKRAQSAPAAANAPREIDGWCRRLEGEPALPIDDSDGGCDDQPQCAQGSPWKRQIDAIRIGEEDAISDSGREIWNLMESRGIRNVLVMGVHTNMCVLGRPFGLRRMKDGGRNVVLVRDLTDTMYNSRRSPHVPHARGTDLVVEHVEKHVCPSVDSRDLLKR